MIDFTSSYDGVPPWEIGRPQPALAGVVSAASGRMLDIGCGTGELAMLAASKGMDATGVDGAANAIEIACRRAADRGLTVDFRVGDALDLPSAWTARFDLVADSGVFHVFGDAERGTYVRSLARVLRPGGTYAMLVFSDQEPGEWGPRRITEGEIRDAFAQGWTVASIDPAMFDLNPLSLGGRTTARALRARLVRNGHCRGD